MNRSEGLEVNSKKGWVALDYASRLWIVVKVSRGRLWILQRRTVDCVVVGQVWIVRSRLRRVWR
jgi:hypothetical protein